MLLNNSITAVKHGAINIVAVYHGAVKVWPLIVPGYVVPGNGALIGVEEFPAIGTWIDNLRRIRPLIGSTSSTGLPATAKDASGTMQQVQEGTVALGNVQGNNRLSGGGASFVFYVAHNGFWHMMTRDEYIDVVLPPLGYNSPTDNLFKGFYLAGGALTKAQALAQVPTNCFAFWVDPVSRTYEVLATPNYIANYMTSGGGHTSAGYALPPGITDRDLIWPPPP